MSIFSLMDAQLAWGDAALLDHAAMSLEAGERVGLIGRNGTGKSSLLQIIANWRIFIKAGEDGWKSIIPIYGDYISYKIAWQPAYFWLTLVLGIVSSCLQGTLETNDSLMISMIIVLIKIILVIISIMYSIKLARAFGRGTGFAIGLIFLPPIFMLILGFGDDRYYGADK